MKFPEKPQNEQIRLETLQSLNILDSSSEERFDRITRLARRLFEVPIALVSLVDADRQWFKSAFGLDVSEISRDVSFCAHAILHNDIFIVPDTLLDERFNSNPLVINPPYIRFYAGCPLTVPNGSNLGTLCLLDHQPHTFDKDERALLHDLARIVEQELAPVQLAPMDELTLLSNKRGFEALAQRALNVCNRLHKPVCVLFFDLDLFKQINDKFGHAEGDHALTAFSQLLRDIFRDSDVVGRYGGDEFAVLLTNTSQEESADVVKRMQQAVTDYNQAARRGYELAFSVGSVEYNEKKHPTIAALLKEADALMYEHKKQSHSDL